MAIIISLTGCNVQASFHLRHGPFIPTSRPLFHNLDHISPWFAISATFLKYELKSYLLQEKFHDCSSFAGTECTPELHNAVYLLRTVPTIDSSAFILHTFVTLDYKALCFLHSGLRA